MTDIEETWTCWCGALTAGMECTASEFHRPTVRSTPTPVRSLYVSGPMSGYEDCNYPAFHEAAEILRDYGYDVVNPAETGAQGGTYTDLIKKDIRHLLECDGVAVLEGWWNSLGSRTEVNLAGVLGKPVRPLKEWLEFSP